MANVNSGTGKWWFTRVLLIISGLSAVSVLYLTQSPYYWDRIVSTVVLREYRQFTDNTVATHLRDAVRVVCWINTFRRHLPTRAVAINNTWGQRCNTLLFVGDTTNKSSSIPTIGFNTTEGHKGNMVERLFKAFDYVYENHLEDGDWFMRSDDDAYIIMENLRHLLTSYDPTEPWYIGRPYSFGTKQGVNSGGAGVVLSKAALELLYNNSDAKCKKQKNKIGDDDLELGVCMYRLGVKIADTRDRFNKTRFHPYTPFKHVFGVHCNPGHNNKTNLRYNCPKGMDWFSDYLISFHHISPAEMYLFEILLYHTRPYGIIHHVHDVNKHDDITANKDIQPDESQLKPTYPLLNHG